MSGTGVVKGGLFVIFIWTVSFPIYAGAIDEQMTSLAVQRATELARFPHTDAERVAFHARYQIPVAGPMVDYFSVKTIEIISAFRRLELIAEVHARVNDLFARGGLSDAEEALRPWRDRLSISTYVEFDQTKIIPDVPDLDVAVESSRELLPMSVSKNRIYTGPSERPTLTGATIEAVFDAPSVGQGKQAIVVSWNGRECARAVVDFSSLD